jgi:hypothetical protein
VSINETKISLDIYKNSWIVNFLQHKKAALCVGQRYGLIHFVIKITFYNIIIIVGIIKA